MRSAIAKQAIVGDDSQRNDDSCENMPLLRTGPMVSWQSARQRARLMRRMFDPGDALNYLPPNFDDVNIIFTFLYLKCRATMCILYFTGSQG